MVDALSLATAVQRATPLWATLLVGVLAPVVAALVALTISRRALRAEAEAQQSELQSEFLRQRDALKHASDLQLERLAAERDHLAERMRHEREQQFRERRLLAAETAALAIQRAVMLLRPIFMHGESRLLQRVPGTYPVKPGELEAIHAALDEAEVGLAAAGLVFADDVDTYAAATAAVQALVSAGTYLEYLTDAPRHGNPEWEQWWQEFSDHYEDAETNHAHFVKRANQSLHDGAGADVDQ